MSLRFLLDTTALSEPIRPAPSAVFLASLSTHRASVAIAATTWHEALYGLARLPPGARRDAIAEYLSRVILPAVPILPYDAEAAEWHGKERARLVAAGLTPAFADGQIAATARTRGLVLVTDNGADFCHFEGLDVVSWKE